MSRRHMSVLLTPDLHAREVAMSKSGTTRTLCFAILIAALGLGACTSRADRETAIERIRGVIARAQAVNNEGDVEGWVALFEDGAVYMPPGQPAVTTRDGLREIARTGFGSWRTEIVIAPDEIVPTGEWAFARSHVTGTATPAAGGEPVSIDLKELALLRHQPDGAWKIARLIINSNGS